jgi:outer membrane receptor protein involved in Fe transport
MWVHDINASYSIDSNIQLYGGVNNLTNEMPFITNYAYPVSAKGRYLFLGVNIKI